MLGVMSSLDRSERRLPTQRVLSALETFGRLLDDYLYLVVPAILRLIESTQAPVTVRQRAVRTLGRLSRVLPFGEYASRIVHPLARVLQDERNPGLRQDALQAICTLFVHLGTDFAVFVPMVSLTC